MQINIQIDIFDDDGPYLVIWKDHKKHGFYKIDAPGTDDLILAAAACTKETALAFGYEMKESGQ